MGSIPWNWVSVLFPPYSRKIEAYCRIQSIRVDDGGA